MNNLMTQDHRTIVSSISLTSIAFNIISNGKNYDNCSLLSIKIYSISGLNQIEFRKLMKIRDPSVYDVECDFYEYCWNFLSLVTSTANSNVNLSQIMSIVRINHSNGPAFEAMSIFFFDKPRGRWRIDITAFDSTFDFLEVGDWRLTDRVRIKTMAFYAAHLTTLGMTCSGLVMMLSTIFRCSQDALKQIVEKNVPDSVDFPCELFEFCWSFCNMVFLTDNGLVDSRSILKIVRIKYENRPLYNTMLKIVGSTGVGKVTRIGIRISELYHRVRCKIFD